MKEFTHPKYPTIHIKLLKDASDFDQLEMLLSTTDYSPCDLIEFVPDTRSVDSKYLYGIFDADKLIGVIDLIEDYPTNQTTFIHQFFIAHYPDNDNLAQALYTALEKTAQETGTTSFEMDAALADTSFFKNLGFKNNKKPFVD